jgi:hypothetical protein
MTPNTMSFSQSYLSRLLKGFVTLDLEPSRTKRRRAALVSVGTGQLQNEHYLILNPSS